MRNDAYGNGIKTLRVSGRRAGRAGASNRARPGAFYWSPILAAATDEIYSCSLLQIRISATSKIFPLLDRAVLYRLVQLDCFAKHQPGVAGCGWLQPGRNFLST